MLIPLKKRYESNYSPSEICVLYCLAFLAGAPIRVAQSAGAVEYNDCTSTEGLDPTPNECPGYDSKQSDEEVPVILGLRGMWSTPSLPWFPGPLWPGMVAPDRALSMG